MCDSRTLSNKINRTQERALRIIYDDYKSNFKELLYCGNFTIHERNIGRQHLAIEAYLVKNGFLLLLLETMFSNLAKVIIIFKHQIPKPYILAANLLRHYEQKYGILFQQR